MPVFPPKRSLRAHGSLAAVDLFSGVGGLSLGLLQAGFSIRGAIESDALVVEGYRENLRADRVFATHTHRLDCRITGEHYLATMKQGGVYGVARAS